MKRDLARELYRAFRNQPRKNRFAQNLETRSQTDEPQQIGLVLNEIVEARDWRQGLAEGNIFMEWDKIVGIEISTHSTPISLLEGRLTIQTSSTAWATQLNLI